MAGPPAPDVVILAAGRSSRMGQPKGLVRLPGGERNDARPWITHQLDALPAEPSRRVVLVLGADRDLYLRAVPDLASRAVVVVNPDPDRGPFSSLQEGLAAATPGAPVFVLPVDVPAPSPPVWEALDAAVRDGAAAAVPRFEGRGGHPVLLSPAFIAHLRARPPSSRLDEELRLLRDLCHVSVTDRTVRLNLNAPEDWGKVPRGS
jgi:molybdenum cofactor cytidylyltransferase